ncbi:hypothetical protein [uncultured Microbacterium sp.]|uniref:hypothetical protein n=1 Tax=uncultured Microbacterium sp. TaxID=191216 RepID=UPI0028CFE44E|nr:hypothetical protein [uncultured Microbacterium sp.]
MRQRAGIFAGLLIVVSVAVGTAAGAIGVLSAAATTGVRAVLDVEPGADLALRVALPRDAVDEAAQDQLVTATVGEVFRDGSGRGIPLSIVRTVESVAVVAAQDERRSVAVAQVDDIASAATLDAGKWPTTAGEASMQADAATAFGLEVGDELTLDGGVALTLVGTWRLKDPDAPRWMGDALWAAGADDRSVGPVVTGSEVWDRLGITPRVEWTLIPRVDRLQPADLEATDRAWEALAPAFSDAGLGLPNRSGRFVLAAREVEVLVAALRTAAPVALIVLAAIAALSIWVLAGLLVRARSEETTLLWARGATTARLAAGVSGEASVVAAIGGTLGVAAATALLSAQPAGLPSAVASGAVAAAAAVAVSAASFAARTAGASGSVTATSGAKTGARTRRTVAVGVLLVATAGALISTWQLLTSGPLTTTRSGRTEIDPIALLAPALILVAITLTGLYVFPFVVRGAAASSASGTAALSVLALRGLARRTEAAAVSIVIVALAVGQIVLAAGYGASWSSAFAQTQEVRSGAAVTLHGPSSSLSDAELDAAAKVSAIAPVRTADVLLGGERVELLGIAAPALGSMGQRGDGAVDPEALAQAITPTGGAVLPDAATRVGVELRGVSTAQVSIWLSDALGRLREVPTLTAPGEGGLEATADLPDGEAPWRLAAIDVRSEASGPASVAGVSTDAGEIADPVGSTASWRDPTVVPGAAGGVSAPIEPGTLVRFLPPPPVGGAVLSAALAERLGVGVGAAVVIEPADGAPPIQSSVAALSPAIPGSTSARGVLVDAAVVDAALLASAAAPRPASRVWVGTDGDIEATATALRAALPAAVTVDAASAGPDRTMLAAGATVVWLAAAASGVLALAGLVAVCSAQLRQRRGEVAVLRALGVAPGGQSRLRRREMLFATGWALVVGIVAGAAVVLLVVATLARAAVPGAIAAIRTAVHVDVIAVAVAVVILALAIGAVIVVYASMVARDAATGHAARGRGRLRGRTA